MRSVKAQDQFSTRQPAIILVPPTYVPELLVVAGTLIVLILELNTYCFSDAISWLASWLVEL